MKPKTLTGIAILAAILGVVLWWFKQYTPASIGMAAVAPSHQLKPAQPAIIVPPSNQQPVIVTLNAAKPDLRSEANPPTDDPQADLKTAIPDIVRLVRAGDGLDGYKIYTRPDKIDPQKFKQMQEEQQQAKAYYAQHPETQLTVQFMEEQAAEAWEALENQTPTFNTAGDEATYMMSSLGPDGNTGRTSPQVFIKIDGKWYTK